MGIGPIGTNRIVDDATIVAECEVILNRCTDTYVGFDGADVDLHPKLTH